ncbi:hypothetical protein NT6N_35480 [Oceaniferula spumae]|uniref:YbgF trimerisation domain-containing protein n=1 Tax=Oceaniferula spumae TaxID=2979115 RepID=A0AAT9FRA0_9BACT
MNITLPLFSTLALGLIAGVTCTHYHQVSTMVENGIQPSPVILTVPAPNPELEPNASAVMLAATAAPASDAVVAQPVQPPAGYATTQREDALLEMLAAMRSEQKQLRKQLSETNRDMDELTFRVDSQSSDFRPLNTGASRPRGLITAPHDGPDAGADDGSVLPPKR